MKLSVLLTYLQSFKAEDAGNIEIDLLLEVVKPEKCQYQYPVQSVAYSPRENKIIIMHEKFNGEDL